MPETPKNPKKPAPLEATAPKVPGVRPPQPKKPGPPNAHASSAAQKPPAYVWAVSGTALLIILIALAWWLGGSKGQQESLPIVNATASSAPKPTAAQIPAALPVAPGVIATTDELKQPWAAKKFFFRNSEGKNTPAILVRLPGDTYWAIALREPYGSCELEYITDLDKLRTDYNFTATYPMVGDPCTHTVFDLDKYGSGPSGEVRGDIVSGPGVRPPLAIEVQVKGSQILATRSEADILH